MALILLVTIVRGSYAVCMCLFFLPGGLDFAPVSLFLLVLYGFCCFGCFGSLKKGGFLGPFFLFGRAKLWAGICFAPGASWCEDSALLP